MDEKTLLKRLNERDRTTLMDTLEIRYSGAGEDFLEATMPVVPAVHQPMGILHGGATAALAESVGSAASAIRVNLKTHYPVGLELSINHLRSIREGDITARAEAVHVGRSTHLWSIRTTDQDSHLIAVAKLTMMILAR